MFKKHPIFILDLHLDYTMRFNRYGDSRTDTCPFCSKIATTKSVEGFTVCSRHKNNKMPELKCICGQWLDIKKGNKGPYFQCINCGNVNFNRIAEVNIKILQKEDNENHDDKQGNNKELTNKPKKETNQKKETVITSDELDLL